METPLDYDDEPGQKLRYTAYFVLFLVLAITGILCFFICSRLHGGRPRDGTGFVVVATAHTILNWKALRRHFRKRVFAFNTVVVLLLSIGFVIQRTNMPGYGLDE